MDDAARPVAGAGHALDEAADWNPVAGTVQPDPSTRALYDELYGIYRELYPATLEQAHALAAIQER